MAANLLLLLSLAAILHSRAQSIEGLGGVGGSGPRGGIGDVDDPVLEAQSFVTDAIVPLRPNTTRQLATGRPPVLVTNRNNATAICPPPRLVEIDTVDGARQEMLGFGFSWTDSSVSNFNRLEPDVLERVMGDLFSPHPRGNNMGMMRHTIGSSDMSAHQYSFDDNGPSYNQGVPDLELDGFGLTEDGEAMARMIAHMGTYKSDVFLSGAPWSFPGWMKHNGLFVAPQLSYNVLNNSFDVQYVPQVVRYFTQYLDAYAQRGVTVNGLSLMNEPLNQQGGYPCMFLDASDAAAILNRGLGAALKERNVILMAYDHNTDQPVYPSQVVQRAPGLVSAVAWHCYASNANYSVLDDFHYAYPGIPQFMTECSIYLPKTLGVDWQVAHAFVPAIQHGASGATMWVLATDPEYGPHSPHGGCAGCEGAIVVNSSSQYVRTNAYYMVGQFSRFIRRGARHYRVTTGNVGSHLTPHQFTTIAARNPDGSWAVVFVNNLNRTETVRLSFTGRPRHVWEGEVPNSTVTTWLIPADPSLHPSPHHTHLTPPPDPASPVHDTPPAAPPHDTPATTTNTTTTSSCPLPPLTTASPTSSSNPPPPPLIPVPHTTHHVPQNLLSETSARNPCANQPRVFFAQRPASPGT